MSDRSPEALLADSTWLNRLTRGLVHDPDLAEDVRQETLVAALRSPSGTERSWLARVARNLATSMLRRETRRQRHESAAPPTSRPVTPPDELLAEAEAQQAAVTALTQLDEPYRRTLLLRYMKGLSVRTIARTMDVPVETVRTRIKRGVAQLRTKLDRRPGGRLALVLPMSVAGWPSPTTAALWGVVIMKKKFALACALVAVLASLFGILAYTGPADESPADPVAIAPLQGEGIGVPAPDPLTDGEQRHVIAGDKSRVEDEVLAPVTGGLLVKVVWADSREPASDVCVRVTKRRDPTWRYGFGFVSLRPGECVPETRSTNAAGIARFPAIPAGKREVELDRWPSTRNVEIVAGAETRLDLELEPGLCARGVVVDAGGQAVKGAKVLTWLPGMTPPFWVNVVAESDDEGRFALRGLNEQTFVGARGAGHGVSDFISMMHPDPARDGAVDIRLVLPGGSSRLRGRVLDGDGVPVAAAWVRVGAGWKNKPGGWITPPIVDARTDDEGRFEVDDLREGPYRLQVYARGHAPLVTRRSVGPFRSQDVELQLVRGATLLGRVLDSTGRPLPDHHVSFPQHRSPLQRVAKTDADGVFRITDQGAGPLRVRIRGREFGELDQVVQLAAGQLTKCDFQLQQGLTIRGKLVDQRGAPLAGWLVHGRERQGRKTRRGKTDAEGLFTIPNCSDRPYDLEVLVPQGWMFVTVTVLRGSRPGGSRNTYRIVDRWMPSAVVRGRVFGADGKPLRDVVIGARLVHLISGAPLPRTDAEGRFVTGKLPPGKYEFRFGHVRHVGVKRLIELSPNQEYELENVVMKGRPEKR